MSADAAIPQRPIEYLSSPQAVSMGDDWFQYAVPEHFWMQRRFEVFRRLVGTPPQSLWAEIGCGYGAVMHQMEQQLGIEVDGIDLNEYALKRNTSRSGRLLCYDVLEKRPELRHAYENVLLFDVLEHINDHGEFLDATLHLLKPAGMLVVNVPAFMHFHSRYDVAAGHVRRYDFADMKALVSSHAVQVANWTYWGAPFVPLLVLRKAFMRFCSEENVIRDGFAVGSKFVNRTLAICSRAEKIPQHFHGTSLMVVLRKDSN